MAVGAYLVFGKTSQAPQGTGATSGSQTQDESKTKGSIKSLLSGGRNVMCTVSYPQDSGITGSGTVYVTGNKMSNDFTMTVNNQSADGHIISDGQYLYSWSSQSSQGTKIKIDDEGKQETQSNQNVDLDKNVDLDCSNWSVDNSKFVPPSDVTFAELNIPVSPTQNQSPGQGDGQNPSNVCDQITDPQAKAACMQQTGY